MSAPEFTLDLTPFREQVLNWDECPEEYQAGFVDALIVAITLGRLITDDELTDIVIH